MCAWQNAPHRCPVDSRCAGRASVPFIALSSRTFRPHRTRIARSFRLAPMACASRTARPHARRENDVQDLIQWPGTRGSTWSQGLRNWVRQGLQRIFGTETRADLSMASEVTSPTPAAPHSELAQFPGLVFDVRGVELDDRADQNDAAIRAGLIWFKH